MQLTKTQRLEKLYLQAQEMYQAEMAYRSSRDSYTEQKAKEARDMFKRMSDRHRHLEAGEQLLMLL